MTSFFGDSTTPETIRSVEAAVELLSSLLNAAEPDLAALQALPEDLESLRRLGEHILAIRELALALSQGNIRLNSPARGRTIGALKALQANLRHLAWQTSCIAQGDFSQKVSFMGEFATAFNEMSARLQVSVRELTELSEQYRMLSYEDVRTGLPNRRAFLDMAHREVCRSLRTFRPLCFLFIDIDGFRAMNERHGNLGGNGVLRQVAELLVDALRGEDVCSRLAGDEFALMLDETSLDRGIMQAELLRERIASTSFMVGSQELYLTVSTGLHCLEEDLKRPDLSIELLLDDVFKRGEQALQAAREHGCDCVFYYDTRKDSPVPAQQGRYSELA